MIQNRGRTAEAACRNKRAARAGTAASTATREATGTARTPVYVRRGAGLVLPVAEKPAHGGRRTAILKRHALQPAGAAAGATVGGLAGGGIGSAFDSDKSNYTVVGDNHIEVARQTVVEFQNQVEQNFENLQKAIEDTYITPLTQWLNSLEKEITSLDAYLDEQLKMLKEEL